MRVKRVMVSGYVKLMRPINCMMVGLAVIVGMAIAVGRGLLSVEPLEVASGFTVGYTFCAVSMIVNDIYDIEIDRVNRPERPLPGGEASIGMAWFLAVILSAIGVYAAFLTGLETLVVAVISLLLGVYYNAKGKKKGVLGNVIVAYNIGIPILYGALILGEFKGRIVIYWTMVFLTGLAREIVKDLADVEGDSVKGVKSLAVTRGAKAVVIVSSILYIIAVLLSPLPLLEYEVNSLGYGLPVTVTDMLIIYAVLILARSPEPRSAYKHKNIILLAMMSGLIGFLLGSL